MNKTQMITRKIGPGKRRIGSWTLEKIDNAWACGQGVRRYFWAGQADDGRVMNFDSLDEAKDHIEKVG